VIGRDTGEPEDEVTAWRRFVAKALDRIDSDLRSELNAAGIRLSFALRLRFEELKLILKRNLI
jgi:hypothetical protein